MDFRQDALPVTRRSLAELAKGRIPRAVVTLQQPAPACIKAVEQPYRLSQRASEVDDRGIDSDHEVECIHKGGRIGKIVQFVGPIIDCQPGWRRLGLRRRLALLQRYEADALQIGELRKVIEGDRPPSIYGTSTAGNGVGLPAQTRPTRRPGKASLRRRQTAARSTSARR